MKLDGPLLLLILDGWGVREEREGNAIARANAPFWDYLRGRSHAAKFKARFGPVSYATLVAVGPEVGMPENARGSTAVGHEVLSGVDYRHPMYTIAESIRDGEMRSPVVDDAIKFALERRSALHLMGLISDNREHSDIRHLYAILARAAALGQKKIRLHFFSDGRGSPPQSGPRFVAELRRKIAEITRADASFDIKIATVSGRDLSMNRSALYWTKTESVFRAIVEADAPRSESVEESFRAAYALGLNDQYVPVAAIGDYAGLENHDSLLHFNFRRDRAEFLMKMLVEPEEKIAEILRDSGGSAYSQIAAFRKVRGKRALDFSTIKISALVEYYKGIPCPVAFKAAAHDWTLGRFLSEFGFKQKFISGVDKTAALRLLNGAERTALFPGQESIVVPLPPDMRKYIGDYDLYKGQAGFEQNPYVKFPLVELPELTEVVVRETANSDARTFIAVNVCNPDMVGHTGDMDACVKCVEAIDDSLQRMVEQALKSRGIAVITADHGNIEEIFSEGEPNTYHTRARVPFAILGMPARPLCADGTLKDVAPTVLCLLLGEEKAEVKKHLAGRILFK